MMITGGKLGNEIRRPQPNPSVCPNLLGKGSIPTKADVLICEVLLQRNPSTDIGRGEPKSPGSLEFGEAVQSIWEVRQSTCPQAAKAGFQGL